MENSQFVNSTNTIDIKYEKYYNINSFTKLNNNFTRLIFSGEKTQSPQNTTYICLDDLKKSQPRQQSEVYIKIFFNNNNEEYHLINDNNDAFVVCRNNDFCIIIMIIDNQMKIYDYKCMLVYSVTLTSTKFPNRVLSYKNDLEQYTNIYILDDSQETENVLFNFQMLHESLNILINNIKIKCNINLNPIAKKYNNIDSKDYWIYNSYYIPNLTNNINTIKNLTNTTTIISADQSIGMTLNNSQLQLSFLSLLVKNFNISNQNIYYLYDTNSFFFLLILYDTIKQICIVYNYKGNKISESKQLITGYIRLFDENRIKLIGYNGTILNKNDIVYDTSFVNYITGSSSININYINCGEF